MRQPTQRSARWQAGPAPSKDPVPPKDIASASGFTLLELLLAIGILVLLIAILLPSLAHVREASRRTMCLSNLRQLSSAALAYVHDNDDWFPNDSPRSPYPLKTSDWVWWRASAVHSADVTHSALARYAGGTNFPKILKCPSDDGNRTNARRGDPPYVYSYTMNVFLAGYQHGNGLTLRLGEIRSPDAKILFAEEDERSLNDGGFWHAIPPKTGNDSLSIRHDYDRINPDTFQPENMNRRGNVSFCDGHAEFVDRYFASDIDHFDPAR